MSKINRGGEARHDAARSSSESERLRQAWNLLGLTAELPHDGDWITRDLWGWSVFVQRFGDDIKAFENRCAHRFFPLRVGAKGRGPVRCGFHGWDYDRDGKAVGIPMCKELFGCAPRQLDARLVPVEIAICGTLIFGRLVPPGAGGSLADHLGPFEPIMRVLSAEATAPRRLDRWLAASWRRTYHITLEDYHIVAVHPSTFGTDGPLHQGDYRYERWGLHSAMLRGGDRRAGALERMAAQCADGSYVADGYKVFQLFPNLVVTQYLHYGRWYVLVMQYVALADDRTAVLTWYYPASFANPRSWLRRAFDWIADFPRGVGLRCGINRVVGEDNAICEKLQRIAHQATGQPLLGGQEERIAWFEEAYAEFMTGGNKPAPDLPRVDVAEHR